jgi:hypothetical protein
MNPAIVELADINALSVSVISSSILPSKSGVIDPD